MHRELYAILYDWWRGDCGQLPEGEEMPGEREQEAARHWLYSASRGELTTEIVIPCIEHGRLRGASDTQDFRDWLIELQDNPP